MNRQEIVIKTLDRMSDLMFIIEIEEKQEKKIQLGSFRHDTIKRYRAIYNRLERIKQYNLDIIQGKREDSKLKVA